jgi:TrmH family RNA methyltransferase
VVVAEGLQDPGNLGTIIRTACAAGVDCVVATGPGVDLYNDKVVRATAGTLFKFPVVAEPKIERVAQWIEAHALGVAVADTRGKQLHTDLNWRLPLALVLGNESRGVGPVLHALAGHFLRIPMERGTESLNVGVAAAVFLYEGYRQRGFE